MDLIQKYAPLAGRVLIALLFVPAGFSKITGFAGAVGYISSVSLPFPQVLAVGAIAVELLGGLALLVGFQARIAALAIAAFTLAAAVLFHNFWAVPEAQVMMQQINFFKNVAISGGLLFIAAYGPGPVSFDNRARQA